MILTFLHNLPEGGWRITMETVKALRAEIALSLGYNDEAGYLLRDCQSDFSIAVEESSEPEMYRVFGESLANYTPAKNPPCCSKRPVWRTLRTSRPCRTNGKARKQDWGYWIMLKRTGQAQAVAGCEAYELLMPFPQSEINLLPALTQNSGILTTGKCGTRHGQFRPVGTV